MWVALTSSRLTSPPANLRRPQPVSDLRAPGSPTNTSFAGTLQRERHFQQVFRAVWVTMERDPLTGRGAQLAEKSRACQQAPHGRGPLRAADTAMKTAIPVYSDEKTEPGSGDEVFMVWGFWGDARPWGESPLPSRPTAARTRSAAPARAPGPQTRASTTTARSTPRFRGAYLNSPRGDPWEPSSCLFSAECEFAGLREGRRSLRGEAFPTGGRRDRSLYREGSVRIPLRMPGRLPYMD